MRSGVIAHGGFANRGVHNGIDSIAHAEGAPPFRVFCGRWGFHDDLMRAHSLHRVVASGYFGNDGVVIVGVEPSAIANLSAGFGVERRVVKDDLAGVAGLEFLRTLAALDDGEDFAVVGARLPVSFEIRFRKLLVGRISRLLGRPFPGGASALALLLHRVIKTFSVEHYAEVAAGLFNKISG